MSTILQILNLSVCNSQVTAFSVIRCQREIAINEYRGPDGRLFKVSGDRPWRNGNGMVTRTARTVEQPDLIAVPLIAILPSYLWHVSGIWSMNKAPGPQDTGSWHDWHSTRAQMRCNDRPFSRLWTACGWSTRPGTTGRRRSIASLTAASSVSFHGWSLSGSFPGSHRQGISRRVRGWWRRSNRPLWAWRTSSFFLLLLSLS